MIRISFLIACLITSTLNAQQALTFHKIGQLPLALSAFGYSQDDTKIFTIGGSTEQFEYTSSLLSYNSAINLWLNIPIADFTPSKFASAIYVEKYDGLFVVGGIIPNASRTILDDEIKVIQLDKFNYKPLGPLPYPAKNMGIAYWEDKIYFFGGSTSMVVDRMNQNERFTFSDKLCSYDLTNGVITILEQMPIPMETHGGIIDGILYTFGGFDGSSLKRVFAYDIAADQWKELEPLKNGISSYGITQHDQYFFIAGDYYERNKLIVYDTQSKKAHYFKTNIKGRHLGASVIKDKLHLYGGSVLSNPSSDHYSIDLSVILDQVN